MVRLHFMCTDSDGVMNEFLFWFFLVFFFLCTAHMNIFKQFQRFCVLKLCIVLNSRNAAVIKVLSVKIRKLNYFQLFCRMPNRQLRSVIHMRAFHFNEVYILKILLKSYECHYELSSRFHKCFYCRNGRKTFSIVVVVVVSTTI